MTGRKHDPELFAVEGVRHPIGRVRRGLDLDVKDAISAGVELPHAQVAALRSMADQIDLMERGMRGPRAKAYDRMPFTGLLREFRETYNQTFAGNPTEDPLSRALAEFIAADHATTPSDPTGPGPR